MSEIILQVRVTINDAQVIKMNTKRQRMGRQTRTGVEDAINVIGEALLHNLMFEHPIQVEEVVIGSIELSDAILAALKNSGIDTECGACLEVAFTGVTTNRHTCSSKITVSMDSDPMLAGLGDCQSPRVRNDA